MNGNIIVTGERDWGNPPSGPNPFIYKTTGPDSQDAETATTTKVASSDSSVPVLAANLSRRMATFYNESSAICYLALASTSSTDLYAVQIVSKGYFELPTSYTGPVSAVWASTNGNLFVTEF